MELKVNAMKMIECVKCFQSIPGDSLFCPFCGCKMANEAIDINMQQGLVDEIIMPTDPTNIEAVLKRAFIFLEDGLFDRADRYLEIVLDQDPENAKAYLGRLLVNYQLCKPEELSTCAEIFENTGDFQRALRYATEELAKSLLQYMNDAKVYREISKLEKTYDAGCAIMATAHKILIKY